MCFNNNCAGFSGGNSSSCGLRAAAALPVHVPLAFPCFVDDDVRRGVGGRRLMNKRYVTRPFLCSANPVLYRKYVCLYFRINKTWWETLVDAAAYLQIFITTPSARVCRV